MRTIGIIPARLASTRFPGKPLAKIHGIPMIGHVLARAQMSSSLDKTVVATCDDEIADYVHSIGGVAIMTSDRHERASDRTAEALLKVEEDLSRRIGVVVMIQGDEPLITPDMIDRAIEPLIREPGEVLVSNLMGEIESEEEFEDPNEVKVVVDSNGDAIYFSREPIPSRRKGWSDVPMRKQVCVIPFERDFLLKYNSLEQTPLEKIESVDMLRVLENGYSVRMVPIDSQTVSVDTLEDLRRAEEAMKGDPLLERYRSLA